MSNYRIEGSTLAIPSQLQLFSPLQTPAGIEKIFWTNQNPVNTISGPTSIIDFTLTSNGSHYIDLKRTKLCVRCKVTKGDKTDIEIDENVTFINNPLSSLFSQVDVYLQQKQVSSTGNYPYHAYFHNVLNYGSEALKSQLQLQCFYKDEAGAFDQTQIVPQGTPMNTGAQSRMHYTKGSQIVDMEGPIFSSICNTGKYLLNGIETKIKLQQTRNAFRLMAVDDKDYKVELLEVYLKVCKVAVTSAIIAGHDIALSKTNAIYNFTRNEIKTFTITTGSYNYNVEDFFSGDIPSRLLVCFVSSEAYNGSYKLSPYNFKHYDLSSIGVSVNDHCLPSRAIQPIYNQTEQMLYITLPEMK